VFTDDLGAVTDSITENLIAAKGSISAATQSSQDSADDMKKVVADALTETSKQALSAANQISDHQGKISGGPFAWVRVCLFLFVGCIVFGLVPDQGMHFFIPRHFLSLPLQSLVLH